MLIIIIVLITDGGLGWRYFGTCSLWHRSEKELVSWLDSTGSRWVPVARCYVYGSVFEYCIRGGDFSSHAERPSFL
jgi:hypothetical protein